MLVRSALSNPSSLITTGPTSFVLVSDDRRRARGEARDVGRDGRSLMETKCAGASAETEVRELNRQLGRSCFVSAGAQAAPGAGLICGNDARPPTDRLVSNQTGTLPC